MQTKKKTKTKSSFPLTFALFVCVRSARVPSGAGADAEQILKLQKEIIIEIHFT
jgi:hypothetical protein